MTSAIEKPTREQVVAITRTWVETVVVGHNFCPFARREVEGGSVRYQVVVEADIKHCLEALIAECQLLDAEPEVETTLLIFPIGFEAFDDFLELLDLASALLPMQGYEGVYQLANFHPDYQFEGTSPQEPGNYTNRAPYPTLHLIREASMAQALAVYRQAGGDPEAIPERNIALAEQLGADHLQSQLEACFTPQPDDQSAES